MKVAIVHDWLVVNGGAEKVLQDILAVYPMADLFVMVNYIENNEWLSKNKITTSFIQKLPLAKKKYRAYLPFMPIAVEQFDLSSYDLVISSSYAVAKGVITGPDQLHVCYCHSPMRYAWDLQHQYLKESNMEKGFKSILARFLLHKLRIWDIRSSFGVDYFIANSQFIARRINKVYRRHAEVIYPGVAVTDFQLCENKEDFYLTASRMVPYKRIDLIVEAFAKMPHKKLVVIGDGPEFKKIKALATENICLLGYQSFDVLKEYMQKARAFVFAAEEDFGIVPVEAQACGTPVIAYGKGGCLETVVEGKSGVFFYEQSVRALCDAVDQFEKSKALSLASEIRAHAEQFSSERFRAQIRKFVDEKIEEFNLSRSMKSA